MPVFRNARKSNFVTIQHEIVRDNSISVPARMLLILMLSFPGDWEFNMEWLRANHYSEGRQTTQRAVAELIALGFLRRTPRQGEGGKMRGYVYDVYDERQPVDGKPAAGSPTAGERTTTKNEGYED